MNMLTLAQFKALQGIKMSLIFFSLKKPIISRSFYSKGLFETQNRDKKY